tara:strand:- start:446 stop:742 length:297 start_codon:yes stop_codon:yes gene_type:complete
MRGSSNNGLFRYQNLQGNYIKEMSKDSNEKLYGLQDLLIDEFINRIKSGEASPSDLNAARQLLKDNQISATVTNDNPMANLVSILPFDDEGVDRVASR